MVTNKLSLVRTYLKPSLTWISQYHSVKWCLTFAGWGDERLTFSSADITLSAGATEVTLSCSVSDMSNIVHQAQSRQAAFYGLFVLQAATLLLGNVSMRYPMLGEDIALKVKRHPEAPRTVLRMPYHRLLLFGVSYLPLTLIVALDAQQCIVP